MTLRPAVLRDWSLKLTHKRPVIVASIGAISLLGLLIFFGNNRPYWANQGQATFGAALFVAHNDVCLVEPASSVAVGQGFFLLLSAGLLTGFSHCVGMCGPLVGAFALRRQKGTCHKTGQDYTSSLVLFQSGRLLTYTILGGLAGAMGGMLLVVNLLRRWQGFLAFGLGLLLILMALGLLGWLPTQRWFQSVTWTRWVGAQIQRLLATERPLGLLGLGLVNGLLPCGAIYAMSVLAVSTGSPWQGATLMLVFGLGTLPAMLGLGLSMGAFSLRLRQHLFQLSAFIVLLLGGQLLLRGLALSSLVPHMALGGVMLW